MKEICCTVTSYGSKLSSSVVPLWSAQFSGDRHIQRVTLWSFTAASLCWEAAIRLEKSKHLTVNSRESALRTPCHHTESDTLKLTLMVPGFSSYTSVAFRYSLCSIRRVLQRRKETKGASGLSQEVRFFAWTTPAEKGRSQTLISVQLPEMGVPLKKRQTYSHTMSKKTLMWLFLFSSPAEEHVLNQ